MATVCYEVDNASYLHSASNVHIYGQLGPSARARGEMNGGHNVANLKLPCKYKQQPPICPPHN